MQEFWSNYCKSTFNSPLFLVKHGRSQRVEVWGARGSLKELNLPAKGESP